MLARVPDGGAWKILEFPVSQWLGRRSYSWYLWHWPLLAVLVAMQPELTRSQHLGYVFLCVAGSLGLAAATYAFVENPIRLSGYLARRRVLSLAGAGLVTVITVGTATAWQHSTSAGYGRILAAAQDARTIGACAPRQL
jgi:peptidoglycan/LPS O-acetylase OafA/YrhL